MGVLFFDDKYKRNNLLVLLCALTLFQALVVHCPIFEYN
jgi:hypothetical protein